MQSPGRAWVWDEGGPRSCPALSLPLTGHRVGVGPIKTGPCQGGPLRLRRLQRAHRTPRSWDSEGSTGRASGLGVPVSAAPRHQAPAPSSSGWPLAPPLGPSSIGPFSCLVLSSSIPTPHPHPNRGLCPWAPEWKHAPQDTQATTPAVPPSTQLASAEVLKPRAVRQHLRRSHRAVCALCALAFPLPRAPFPRPPSALSRQRVLEGVRRNGLTGPHLALDLADTYQQPCLRPAFGGPFAPPEVTCSHADSLRENACLWDKCGRCLAESRKPMLLEVKNV